MLEKYPCSIRTIPLAPSLVICYLGEEPHAHLVTTCSRRAVEELSGVNRALTTQGPGTEMPQDRRCRALPFMSPCPGTGPGPAAAGTRGHCARCRAVVSTRSVEHHVHLGRGPAFPASRARVNFARSRCRRAGPGLCQGAPEVPALPVRGCGRAGVGAGGFRSTLPSAPAGDGRRAPPRPASLGPCPPAHTRAAVPWSCRRPPRTLGAA